MQVVLFRKDKSGLSCYYTIDDHQHDLFHPYTLTVRWGKTVNGGQSRSYIFDSLAEKNARIRRLLANKLQTYQILYSFFKESQSDLKAATEVLVARLERSRPA